MDETIYEIFKVQSDNAHVIEVWVSIFGPAAAHGILVVITNVQLPPFHSHADIASRA